MASCLLCVSMTWSSCSPVTVGDRHRVVPTTEVQQYRHDGAHGGSAQARLLVGDNGALFLVDQLTSCLEDIGTDMLLRKSAEGFEQCCLAV